MLIPRSAPLTAYKTFLRYHLDYGDIIYAKTYNSSFHQKIKSVQYNVYVAITGAIRHTSINRKSLRLTRSRVPSTPPLVWKVVLLLQIFQK